MFRPRKTTLFFGVATLAMFGTLPATAWAVVGGENAEDYSWSVRIDSTLDLQGNSVHDTCSGALIADRWVITAAHCVLEPTMVQIGSDIDLRRDPENPLLDPGKVTLHVGSKHRDQDEIHHATRLIKEPGMHDIALIEFDEPTKQTPIPIADSITRHAGQQATVLGWGKTCPEDSCNKQIQILQQLGVAILSSGKDQGDDTSHVISWNGTGTKRTASGDSGGPVIVNHDGQLSLIGTITGGTEDVDAETGALITHGTAIDIPSFTSWIRREIGITASPSTPTTHA